MANVFLNTAICQAQILAGLDSQTLSYLCHPHLYCCLFPKSSGTCRTLRGRVSLSMCAGLGDMGNRVRDSLCHSGSLRWATTSSSVQNGIFLKVWRPLGKLETVRMSFPALPEPPQYEGQGREELAPYCMPGSGRSSGRHLRYFSDHFHSPLRSETTAHFQIPLEHRKEQNHPLVLYLEMTSDNL